MELLTGCETAGAPSDGNRLLKTRHMGKSIHSAHIVSPSIAKQDVRYVVQSCHLRPLEKTVAGALAGGGIKKKNREHGKGFSKQPGGFSQYSASRKSSETPPKVVVCQALLPVHEHD